MPRNGSGSYSLPAGNPFIPSTVISSTTMNNTMSDIGTALTQSLSNDGQTTPVANLPMATFRHTNVGNAVARTDYAAAGQVQDSSLQWLTSVAGTNTITASVTPSPTAYTAGQTFRFVSAGANTGATTLNINGLGAKSITKNGTAALAAGDIGASTVIEVTYDGTQFQLMSGTGSGRFLGQQVFTANGTYTPSPGMRIAVVYAQGGGGAGSGSGGAGVGNVSAGAPGGNGTYAEGIVTAATVGASQAVTIGAGGTGVAAGAGNAGGSTSLGALVIAPGGPGGGAPIVNNATPLVVGNGSLSGAATGASYSSLGQAQHFSQAYAGAAVAIGGPGGQSVFGAGGRSVAINTNGANGLAYGSGGGGTVVNQAGGNATGGAGVAGILIIHEYS